MAYILPLPVWLPGPSPGATVLNLVFLVLTCVYNKHTALSFASEPTKGTMFYSLFLDLLCGLQIRHIVQNCSLFFSLLYNISSCDPVYYLDSDRWTFELFPDSGSFSLASCGNLMAGSQVWEGPSLQDCDKHFSKALVSTYNSTRAWETWYIHIGFTSCLSVFLSHSLTMVLICISLVTRRMKISTFSLACIHLLYVMPATSGACFSTE